MGTLTKQLPYGKLLWLKPVNSNSLQVWTNSSVTNIEVTKDLNRDIKSFTIGENYTIHVGDSITIPCDDCNKKTYEVNTIIRLEENSFLLLTHLKNKTSLYILPVLDRLTLTAKASKLDYHTKQEITHYCANTYLINAYLGKDGKTIDLLYRFSTHQTYRLLEECLLGHPRILKVVDGFKNKEYVIFRFNVPIDYVDDIELFRNGKYSQMSSRLKREIIKFHKFTSKSRVYQVLYKKEELRLLLERELAASISEDSELDSVPDPINEYLDI